MCVCVRACAFYCVTDVPSSSCACTVLSLSISLRGSDIFKINLYYKSACAYYTDRRNYSIKHIRLMVCTQFNFTCFQMSNICWISDQNSISSSCFSLKLMKIKVVCKVQWAQLGSMW